MLQVIRGTENPLAKAAAAGKPTAHLRRAAAHDLDQLQRLAVGERTLAGWIKDTVYGGASEEWLEAASSLAPQEQHGAGQVGTCGVSGGGGRGVAGRSANDRLGSALDGFGNGHRHPAIFERSRRVESLVFDVDLRAAPDEAAQLRRINQRGGSLVERDHGGGLGDWEVLPVAADHPSIVPVCHEAASTR